MLQRLRHICPRQTTRILRMSLCNSHSGTSNNPPVTIGTHDGKFHADEVLACALLKRLPRYEHAQILRTRNEEVLKTCDIVVDVGAVYDPTTHRYDHHQKSFDHSMSTVVPEKPWTTRLSSAGLVYAHFGREVLLKVTQESESSRALDSDGLETLYDKMYEVFVQSVDAIDNGIPLNQHSTAYKITTDFSSRIGYLNSGWKDDGGDEDENKRFHKAVEVAGDEFFERVHYYREYWLEAYQLVKEAIDSRHMVDPSGLIMEFVNGGMPWKDHLAKLEVSMGLEELVQFVIFPDGKGKWRVQGVPIEPQSFILRTPLNKAWQGVRDQELSQVSGIPTAHFVHASGFIGGAADRGDAIRMAKDSLPGH